MFLFSCSVYVNTHTNYIFHNNIPDAGTVSNLTLISITSSTIDNVTFLTCSAMFNGSSVPATEFRWDGPVTAEGWNTNNLTLGSINETNVGQYFCTANGSITTSVNITLRSKCI